MFSSWVKFKTIYKIRVNSAEMRFFQNFIKISIPVKNLKKIRSFLICSFMQFTCDSKSMVCASLREDNSRASASGLLPVQTHEPYSN